MASHPRRVRALIVAALVDIRQASLALLKVWKMNVTVRNNHGHELPEHQAWRIREAYTRLALLEMRALRAQIELRTIMLDLYGPEAIEYMVASAPGPDVNLTWQPRKES